MKGYIYKIVNTITPEIYVGSTSQTVHNRFKAHRSNAKLDKDETLYDHMRTHGVENFSIEIVEEVEYIHKQELTIKEQEYYRLLSPSLNMIEPRIVPIYEYGRIYKLFYILDQNQFYIGSTTKTKENRLSCHRSASKTCTTPIYKFMTEHGSDNFDISIVEDNVPYNDMINRENHWIQELKPPLNTNFFLCRTEQERDKAKYENNKEQIKARVNKRRMEKRDEINAQKKVHYALNKERILAKQSTQEYKDNANEKRRERRKLQRAKRMEEEANANK